MNIVQVFRNLLAACLEWAYYSVGNIRAGVLGVRLGRGARVSPHAVLNRVHALGAVTVGREVSIDEGTYIGSGVIMSGQLGRWCSLGYDVLIGPTEHQLDGITTSPILAMRHGGSFADVKRLVAPPVLEDEVWVGARVVVLRGVRVGKGAVLAAGAVVTRDVPSMEIWGGVPARLIRHRQPPLSPALPTGAEF